jgi:hypothetical protein
MWSTQVARAGRQVRSLACGSSNAARQDLPDDMRMSLGHAPLDKCEGLGDSVHHTTIPSVSFQPSPARLTPSSLRQVGECATCFTHMQMCGASKGHSGVSSISITTHRSCSQKPALSIVRRHALEHDHARARPFCERPEIRRFRAWCRRSARDITTLTALARRPAAQSAHAAIVKAFDAASVLV